MSISSPGCAPLLYEYTNLNGQNAKFYNKCIEAREKFLNNLYSFEIIILAARWSLYDHDPIFLSQLDTTLKKLLEKNKKILLVGQIPELSREEYYKFLRLQHAPYYKFLNKRYSFKATATNYFIDGNKSIEKRIQLSKHVKYFDLMRDLKISLPMYRDNMAYMDEQHLNEFSSRRIGRVEASGISKVLQALL